MQYFRCKCGTFESWSSMGVSACQGCDKCGTTLEQSSTLHAKPAAHEIVKRYSEKTGELESALCTACLESFKLDAVDALIKLGRAVWKEDNAKS